MKGTLVQFGAGAGIGWLVGLSSAPVIGTLIAALVGAVLGWKALTSQADWAAYQGLGWVIIGVAVGASGGVSTREHEWLGPSSVSSAIELRTAENEYLRTYFAFREKLDPTLVPLADASLSEWQSRLASNLKETNPVLFSAIVKHECERFLRASGLQLADELKASANPAVKAAAVAITSEAVLDDFRRALCD
ncbi:hypothetical protein JYT20_00100 [Rhodothermus sp. AH-315-K08]|nr:hypothetical protein [Rhodothermus sp. AH-315-K08]